MSDQQRKDTDVVLHFLILKHKKELLYKRRPNCPKIDTMNGSMAGIVYLY